VFKYGLDNGLIDKPIRYGGEFRKPDKAILRRHRAMNGEKMLEANQLRALIEAASIPLRAMILLGLNAGFGNHDCSSLPISALDLNTGWIAFSRPKTGIPRRCPLWPETIAAIREALVKRPEPGQAEVEGLVFLTARATPWIHTTPAGGRDDNIAIQFRLLLMRLGWHRPRLGFYVLRHVFRTVSDAARDPVAIDLIMGHADPTMGGHYRERIDDSRLRAVADYVRTWLFGAEPDGGNGSSGATPVGRSTGEVEGDRVPDREDGETSVQSDRCVRGEEDDARPTLRLFAG
jgi:integrase